MSREPGPDELDLTEAELVSAMSAAVGRLRQLAAAAFDAGREEATPAGAAQSPPAHRSQAHQARSVSQE